VVRRLLGPAVSVLLGGASGACGFAALGLALYANRQPLAAATLFGAFGFAVGALCVLLTPLRQRLPAQRPADLQGEALASMVRATLALAAAERGARSGSPADRRPAEVAAAALALAASPGAADRAGQAGMAATAATPTPLAAPAPADRARAFAGSASGA